KFKKFSFYKEFCGICASHRVTPGVVSQRKNCPMYCFGSPPAPSFVWISPTAVGDQRRRLWTPQAFKKLPRNFSSQKNP
ncbi:MAG: hypothetical protein PUB99_07600, partial [Oscillospiraceae bacterium]|nr:hypothetical protein [Oscillospiraceae bacterium]